MNLFSFFIIILVFLQDDCKMEKTTHEPSGLEGYIRQHRYDNRSLKENLSSDESLSSYENLSSDENFSSEINYQWNKFKFCAPCRRGSKLLLYANNISDHGTQYLFIRILCVNVNGDIEMVVQKVLYIKSLRNTDWPILYKIDELICDASVTDHNRNLDS